MQRGNFLSIFFLMVLVFGLFIAVPLGTMMMGEVATGFTNAGMNDTADHISSARSQVINVTNTGFVFIFIGSGIAIILGSTVVFSSPLMFVLGLFTMIIGVIMSMVLSNASISIAGASAVTAEYVSYDLMQTLMGNLPYFVLILAVIILVVFTAKKKTRDSGETYV